MIEWAAVGPSWVRRGHPTRSLPKPILGPTTRREKMSEDDVGEKAKVVALMARERDEKFDVGGRREAGRQAGRQAGKGRGGGGSS